MTPKEKDKSFENIPDCARDYINFVIKKMRYRKKARLEVRQELIDHFEEHLKDYTHSEERQQKAQQLIEEFGDAKLLAVLMRRAKKRCRPMWQKALIKTAAVLSIAFLYLLICFAHLIIGKPTVKINYAQWLTNQQRQGRDESLNAVPEIEKAISLYDKTIPMPEMKSIKDINYADKTAIIDFLKINNKAIDTLEQALDKPYYWVKYNAQFNALKDVNSFYPLDAYLVSARLPFLGNYRMLARSINLRANFRVYEGNIDGAIQDELSLFKFGYLFEGKGLLVEQLVATAIEGLSNATIMIMLSDIEMSAEQLKRIQDTIENSFVTEQRIIDLNGEKVLWYDSIQHLFTDDGKGNGKVLKNGLPFVVKGWEDALCKTVSFNYPSRTEFLTEVESFFERSQRLNEISPWTTSQTKQVDKNAPNFMMMKILESSFDSVYRISWRLKTQREALLSTLAILRFQKETGRYPEQLDELVKNGYLRRLPIDPFSGAALTYKKTGGDFLLYSWGSNLKDDGGQVFHDEKGKIKPYGEQGDWVFWPISKIWFAK